MVDRRAACQGGGCGGRGGSCPVEPHPITARVEWLTTILRGQETRYVILVFTPEQSENRAARNAMAAQLEALNWTWTGTHYKIQILNGDVWWTPKMVDLVTRAVLAACPLTRRTLTMESVDLSFFNDGDHTKFQTCAVIISDTLHVRCAASHRAAPRAPRASPPPARRVTLARARARMPRPTTRWA